MADDAQTALVLTEANAAGAGYVGEGPFTFAGAYPGVWLVDRPVRISALGFDSDDDALAAADEAGVPLEQVTVPAGTAEPLRENHALGESEARDARFEQTEEQVARIRTHAQADEAAAAAGMPPFPEDPRPTVDEKVAAIEAFKTSGPVQADGLLPAAGVEDTVPAPPEGEGAEG